jgi:hypothetical protein
MFSKTWYTTSFSNKAKVLLYMDMLNRYPKIPRNGACLYFVLSCAVQIGKAVASHELFWENIIACQLMCYLFLLHATISSPKFYLFIYFLVSLDQKCNLIHPNYHWRDCEGSCLKEHWSRNKMYCNPHQSTLKISLSCRSYWPESIPECTPVCEKDMDSEVLSTHQIWN